MVDEGLRVVVFVVGLAVVVVFEVTGISVVGVEWIQEVLGTVGVVAGTVVKCPQTASLGSTQRSEIESKRSPSRQPTPYCTPFTQWKNLEQSLSSGATYVPFKWHDQKLV